MKKDNKKIYFIIASIIQIIIAVYTILNVQAVLESSLNLTLDFLGMFPQQLRNELMLLMTEILTKESIIFDANIYLIVNLIILYVSMRCDIITKKKLLIILSIIAILCNSSVIGIVLLITNLIILGCMPSAKANKEKKTKKKALRKYQH